MLMLLRGINSLYPVEGCQKIFGKQYLVLESWMTSGWNKLMCCKVLFNKQKWKVSTTSEPLTVYLLGHKISWRVERLVSFHLRSYHCWCLRFYSLPDLLLPQHPLGSLVLLWHIAEPFLHRDFQKPFGAFLTFPWAIQWGKFLYARPDDNHILPEEGGQNRLQDRMEVADGHCR